MNLTREKWVLGWTPSADSTNGDISGLLRMDNCRLDDIGALTLNHGVKNINQTQFPGFVHSIWSHQIGGTKHRFVGISTGSVIRSTDNFNTEDIIIDSNGSPARARFASVLGSIFISSNERKKKFDGQNDWNWGIPTPKTACITTINNQPTYNVANLDGNGGGNNWVLLEGGGGSAFRVAGNSIVFSSTTDTLRAIVATQYAGGATIDFTQFPGQGSSLPTDTFNLNTTIADTSNLIKIRVEFFLGPVADVTNIANNDYYWFEWQHDVDQQAFVEGVNATSVLNAARQDFTRQGTDQTLDWSTVGAARVTYLFSSFDTREVLGIFDFQWTGSTKGPINGQDIQYISVNVRDNGVYQAKSGHSPFFVNEALLYVVNGSVTVFPEYPADPQVNHIWIYRKGGNLTDFLRIADITITNFATGAGTYIDASGNTGSFLINNGFTDVCVEADVQTLDLAANIFTKSFQDISDEIFSIVDGIYYERLVCCTSTQIFLSESLNPDAIDVRATLRVSGDQTETNFWVSKIANNLLLVGTSKNIYQITGDLTLQPDGTINAQIVAVGEQHPPIALEFALDSGVIFYMSNDGWRSTNGARSELLSAQLNLMFRGESRYGLQPVSLYPNALANYPATIYKGQLITSNISADGTRPVFIYDFLLQYWRLLQTDPISLFTEEDGTLLGGYGNPGDFYIKQMDTGFTIDRGGVSYSQKIYIQTVYDSNQTPRNRKDMFTLKLTMDTGNQPVEVHVGLDGGGYVSLGFFQANGMSTLEIDLFSPITQVYGLPFRISLLITSDYALTTFKLARLDYEYAPRPEQLTQLRILPTNLGSYSRKRFTNFAFVIDTLGNTVKFQPNIDLADTTTPDVADSFTTAGKQTYIYYFKQEQLGTDIGGLITATGSQNSKYPAVFEYYEINLDEIVSEKLPVPVKYLVIPANNYGTPDRKRHSSYKFQINTRGQNVLFTPILDGAGSLVTSMFNTTTKRTVEHFFTADTIAIDVGGTLQSQANTPFEFYGVIVPQVLEVLPPRLLEYRIPESNLRVAAKKRIRTLPFMINTNGQNVVFTPIVDNVAGIPTTFNTPLRQTVFHYFSTDSFGVDYSGELKAQTSTPFELYGPDGSPTPGFLQPEIVEVLPVTKVFDQVGPVHLPRVGKIIGLRLRVIATDTSLPWTMYEADNVIATGTLTTYPNLDWVYEQEWIQKSRNATVTRIEIGPSPGVLPFNRYYLDLKVNYGGGDTEIKWLRVAQQDANVNKYGRPVSYMG